MASAWQKGRDGFPVCGSSNVHAKSRIWTTDIRILDIWPETFSNL